MEEDKLVIFHYNQKFQKKIADNYNERICLVLYSSIIIERMLRVKITITTQEENKIKSN